MARTQRVALVTFGLVAAGAAAGAAAAYLGLAAVILTSAAPARGLRLLAYGPVVALLLGRGALIGAVAGPAVAWGLLRRVPLGRAVAGLGVGALVGGLGTEILTDARCGGSGRGRSRACTLGCGAPRSACSPRGCC